MGSMLKFDSERRELVRERRNARIERKLERRQARERKHSQTADVPSAPSATQVLAERELRSAVDRIVIDALDRHERIAPPATPPAASTRLPEHGAGAGACTDGHAPAGWRRGAGAARVAPRARPRRVPGASPPDARGGARRGPPADRAGRGAGVGRRRVRGARAPGGRAVERGARAARGGDRDRADRRGRRRRPPSACGRSAATPRGRLPAGPGATRSSRWRRAWRTRSSHGCRGPRSGAPSAHARSRKRDRIAGARSGAEGARRAADANRRRRPRPGRCARAPRRRFGRPTPREEVP